MDENLSQSPLSFEDALKIQQLPIDPLDKHHIRLLAHCLECFKKIAVDNDLDSMPSSQQISNWCKKILSNDDEEFFHLFFSQLENASTQLKNIGKEIGKYPLSIDLEDLIEALARDR